MVVSRRILERRRGLLGNCGGFAVLGGWAYPGRSGRYTGGAPRYYLHSESGYLYIWNQPTGMLYEYLQSTGNIQAGPKRFRTPGFSIASEGHGNTF